MTIGIFALVRGLKLLKKPGPEAPKSEKPLGKVPEISAGAKRLKF